MNAYRCSRRFRHVAWYHLSAFAAALVASSVTICPAQAALDVVVDFTGFAGGGFASTPASGQLDSDFWRVTGLSDGTGTFGGTHTAGDFARGLSSGGVTTGGIYAFDVGGGDIALGVQPAGTDFTGGTIELRITNTTGSPISGFDIEYDIFLRNDEDRANSFNFQYRIDAGAEVPVPFLDFTSPVLADTSPLWSGTAREATILATVPAGSTLDLIWRGDDVGGSGSRDEFALDNVSFSAIPEPSSLLIWACVIGAALLRLRARDKDLRGQFPNAH